ncbi:isochorismate-pyruvate lyase [Burkholderia sp. AU31652]|uniref:isochorismate lyase n=1 Tax=unclassified Burkholderia TaxID=2613784 RepID=UPI000B7A7F75|nr:MULTISPECIES: isochorismate lyase [unclassified Burkholderia]MDN7489313.1 isochorismate lyase [Burkholderia sp. AU45274]OXI84938.1 isochorismate-pyruvate lyase [Burkholderia sp. AU31652]OXJ09204.1 isochorismate-pyruvate lyase [Burkholderia sp. HI2500]
MKTPDACTGLPDIREAIDRLDADIIEALGLRMQYVKAASRFKPDEASIAAPERVAAMLPDRRRWAEQAGLDADYVETLFSGLIAWYIAQQTQYWRQQRGLA